MKEKKKVFPARIAGVRDRSAGAHSKHLQKLIRHINRKYWWHVRPADCRAYAKRGKFFSSTFKEAEFYGRPIDEPEKVAIARPLVGDNDRIEKQLIGRVESHSDVCVQRRLALDAKLRCAAIRNGFDSIVLFSPTAFQAFNDKGVIPRSIELNVVDLSCLANLKTET